MSKRDVLEAFFYVTHGRLPMRVGKDKLFASLAAMPFLVTSLSPEMGWVIAPDPCLQGVEMRLEWGGRGLSLGELR